MSSKIVKTAIENFESTSIKLVVNFQSKPKNTELKHRYHHELSHCEVGKVVVLFLKNGKSYVGLLNGIQDETVVLKSTTKNVTISFKKERIGNYFEEVTENECVL